VVTAGDRPGSLEPRGISGSIDDVLWPLLHGTYWYTGMQALRPHLLSIARDLAADDVAALDRDLVDRLRGVAEEEPIPYLPLSEDHYDHAIRLHPGIVPGQTGLAAHLGGERNR